MLTLTHRYRIYPDFTQEQILIEWMEICRGAYNYALREIKDWCDSRKCPIDRCSLEKEYIISPELKFPGEIQQLNNLPKAKKEFPKLNEVPSQVLQQAIKQLHRGWQYFQQKGFGFPRLKKYGRFKSLLFPQFRENPVTNLHIKLPKIGAIPINLHRPIPTGFAVKQVRISRGADKWYASISLQCDVNVPNPTPYGYPIGVDVGLEKFLTTSEGILVKPPKFFKQLQSKLKLLQRRLKRKQRRSKNYEKQRLKVARIHHQIDNTRKDFHYKQAHTLCDAGDMIFMEDLDYRTSAKGMFGKQMLDAAFCQFRTIVKHVCWKRGKFFEVVDARGTSQECPECGGEVKKNLSVRVHNCPHCGYTTHRDVAAAQNIRNRGIKLIGTVGQTGRETACAVELPGTDESQSRQVAKSRQRVTRKPKK
ncbi:MAG TPA: transposase [Cyanobacteria bacterium UBA11149]|nr:transposase [Cyanobacteria bacterium UBA11367]HBE57096.1 transposase [Cyanobacteria bacterium UBA11366]HBK62107.1 transposase [Cyanobacteria bacterium UBA11166]HBR76639.1 transposase [Cyanobacteria bacterium UBA11159]HBS68357.1 transposase [Cyanobacteria bacterium UBA11153]HBW92413.1 transposase [Cyanobacteria bacterium UBA11149]HCA94836.1 transposase [Cyanobacteria bacterium UBA9226]